MFETQDYIETRELFLFLNGDILINLCRVYQFAQAQNPNLETPNRDELINSMTK